VDWHAWHGDYDRDTPLARRLGIVQLRIRELLTASAGRPLRLLSICAGDGRDIVGALDGQPGTTLVSGRLVELDPDLAAAAQQRIALAGLTLDVLRVDAGSTDAYAGAAPADLVLACGVFGNISDADVRTTVRALPMLVAPSGTVIWTRHRGEPDLTPAIRSWFSDVGFAELAFTPVPDSLASVGVHRLTGPPIPFEPGRRLFVFTRTA
jgi:hypothetical protein